MFEKYSRIAIRLLLVLALIQGAVIVWTMYENSRLRRELAMQAEALHSAQKRSLQLEADLKKSKPVAEVAAETTSQEEPAATSDAGTSTAKPSRTDGPRKVDMKELMIGKVGEITARSSVSMLYGDFLAETNLTSAERQQLQEILVEQERAEMARQWAAHNDGTSHAEQEKLNKAAANAKLKQLLGNDRFQQYLTYTEQIPDRMKVSYFNNLLANSSSPIQPEQKKQLLNVILDERQKFNAERKLSGAATKTSGEASDFFQRLGNRWAGVLNPEQLVEYNKWRDAMVEYVRFMETGETKAPPPSETAQ